METMISVDAAAKSAEVFLGDLATGELYRYPISEGVWQVLKRETFRSRAARIETPDRWVRVD